jgi:O-acetyl-ADP-ribose deacetylase (regulator of RNase III)
MRSFAVLPAQDVNWPTSVMFETSLPGMSWKTVFHTVATDELYNTRPETVVSILRKCLRRCIEMQGIKSIITSPLGAGYGDLDLEHFVRIADQVCSEFDKSPIQSFAIVCRDEGEFASLTSAAKAVHGNWEVSPRI